MRYGVFLGGPGTVTNLGSISGRSYAVDFSVNSSANLLQVGAGATFTGSVNGDGGAIELLSGGAGTIGGISNSGQFWGFQSLNVDAGGNWTLTGSDAIANVTDNGALTVNGSLDVTSALNAASTGAFDLGAGGVLEVASASEWRTGLEGLSPRELRVVQLAAEGRTNREIAYQLYVTLKTIEGHLARAYTKLGIERRGQLSKLFEGEKTRAPSL